MKRARAHGEDGGGESPSGGGAAPGKRTRSESLRAVQRKESGAPDGYTPSASPIDGPHDDPFGMHLVAREAPASALPHQAQMERLFGEDLSGVTAHVGASASLGAAGARGAAQGDTVAFASANPSPSLVAHETAHVVQQRRAGGGAPAFSRKESSPGDPAEVEADGIAALVESEGENAEPVEVSAAPSAEVHFDRGAPPAPPAGGQPPPESFHSDGRPALLEWAGVTPLRDVRETKDAGVDDVKGGTVAYEAEYAFALQGDREVGSKAVFAVKRAYRVVLTGGLKATITIDSRAHLNALTAPNNLHAMTELAAVWAAHDALITVEGPETNQVPPVTRHARGQSLSDLIANDPLLAFDTSAEDRAAHLQRRVFGLRERDRLVKNVRKLAPDILKSVERLKAHTAAMKNHLDGDRESLLDAEDLLAQIAALKAQLQLDVERKEGATESQLKEAEELHKALLSAYVEAKNAKHPDRSLADHAKDVAMAPVHAVVGVGEGAVELGKMGVDGVRATADAVANLFGSDIEWNAYSGVGKALQDGKGAGEILVAAWDGFVDSIDKAIEQAKNGNYGPLLDLKASIELEVAITLATGGSYAPAAVGAKVATAARTAVNVTKELAEATAKLTRRTAKALKDARQLLKMPGVKAWAKDFVEGLADSLDTLGKRAALAEGAPDELLRHLPDAEEGNRMFRQSALDVAKGDAAATLKKRGGAKGKRMSAAEANHLVLRLEGLIDKASGSREIKAVFEAMKRVDNLPGYVDAIERLLALTTRIEQPDLLKVLKRSTAVVDGAQFLDDVAWVAKRDISAAARSTLFDKAARGMAPDFAWLKKTTLTDRYLEYLAENPATNWKAFMKVSAEESDQFPMPVGERGLDGGDHAQAATKLRGVAGELVVKDMKLPGGLKIVRDQVDANGKLIDFGIVDASGQPALLEVKAWAPKKWKQQLAAHKNRKGDEALVHALSQLEAATRTGKPVYLAVSDKLDAKTLETLKEVLAAEELPVKLVPVSETAIKSTAHDLRAMMGIGAGVAFFLDNDDDSMGSEDDEPDGSAI